MRLALMLLLLIAGCGPASAFENANELLSSCERFLGAVRLQGNLFSIQGNDPNAYECWGYIQAFQDLSALIDEGAKATVIRACPPATSSGIQLVRVFVSFAQKHPEHLHEKAGSMALDAFRTAFPCPRR
jgi:Rap1a immunity proteins